MHYGSGVPTCKPGSVIALKQVWMSTLQDAMKDLQRFTMENDIIMQMTNVRPETDMWPLHNISTENWQKIN